MNPFILLAILLLLMVVGHFIIKRFAPTTSVDRYYLPVHAGQNDGVLRPSRKYLDIANYNLTNGGIPINESNYEAFIVDGESMSNVNIHSEDIVLVKILRGEERLELKKDNILVFTYDVNCDETGTKAYKLRQFIDFIKINDDINIDEWCVGHGIIEKTRFQEKWLKAKEREYKDSDLYLCSKTWKNGNLDYSFHSIVNLYGKVDYCVPKSALM